MRRSAVCRWLQGTPDFSPERYFRRRFGVARVLVTKQPGRADIEFQQQCSPRSGRFPVVSGSTIAEIGDAPFRRAINSSYRV